MRGFSYFNLIYWLFNYLLPLLKSLNLFICPLRKNKKINNFYFAIWIFEIPAWTKAVPIDTMWYIGTTITSVFIAHRSSWWRVNSSIWKTVHSPGLPSFHYTSNGPLILHLQVTWFEHTCMTRTCHVTLLHVCSSLWTCHMAHLHVLCSLWTCHVALLAIGQFEPLDFIIYII